MSPSWPCRPPELAGGSWARGYREFFGEKAACSKCHTLYGRGGNIGPDLSNLVHRDYASVLRDITHPSFAINPDYLSYTVTLTDGRVLTGVVRTTGDTVAVGDAKGVTTELKRADVDEMRAVADLDDARKGARATRPRADARPADVPAHATARHAAR